jgi:alpha-tubulin suppressor-like RCC1 family protein
MTKMPGGFTGLRPTGLAGLGMIVAPVALVTACRSTAPKPPNEGAPSGPQSSAVPPDPKAAVDIFGDAASSSTPALANAGDAGPVLPSTPALALTMHGRQACAILADGTVRCWGERAVGDFPGASGPSEAARWAGLEHPRQLAIGDRHWCALDEKGRVTCAPDPIKSKGDAGTSRPATVSMPPTTQIAAGARHACALGVDRKVRCWGDNDRRQCGPGVNPPVPSNELQFDVTDAPRVVTKPTIEELPPVSQLALGAEFSCALGVDHSVHCWGRNHGGGRFTAQATALSLPVRGMTTAKQISAGSTHACGSLEDGTVRCWGNNAHGQLGDGTTTNRVNPAVASDLRDVEQLAAGADFSCARLADGRVRCWGKNDAGQLGVAGDARSSPAEPVPIGRALEIAAGEAYVCARLADTSVWCWGDCVAREPQGGPCVHTPSPIRW